MDDENPYKSKPVKDIVTLLIGFASLVFADNSVFRSFFGVLLLAVLFKDLRKPYTRWDRFIVSMAMSFATITACSYYLTSFLNAHGWALLEDKIIIIGLVSITILFYVLKSKYEHRTVRGES